MRRMLPWIVLVGCGGKVEAPTEVLAVPAEAVAAQVEDVAVTADVAAEIEDVAKVEEVAAKAEDVAQVEDAAQVAEAAAKGDDVAVVEALAAADEVVVDPNAPVVAGLDPGAATLLMKGAPGCVGMSKNGKFVLSIVEGKDGDTTAKQLRFAEATASGFDYVDEKSWPLTADVHTNPELLAAIAGQRLNACHTTALPAEKGAIPKATPIVFSRAQDEIKAQIEGNAPATFSALDTRYPNELVSAYWTQESGRVFVRLSKRVVTGETQVEDGVVDLVTSGRIDGFVLASVTASALSQSECLPRPVGKPRVEAPTPPPFDPAPAEVGCVAMTKDGQMAAFKSFASDPSDERGKPNHIKWVGKGTAPDIDLSCMAARRCTAEDKAALASQAAMLGLVGCAEVKKTIVIDGQLVPFRRLEEELKIESSVGLRTIYKAGFKPTYVETPTTWLLGPLREEKLWRIVQHPAGGPVFVYSGWDDDGVDTADATMLDAEALKLCAPAPEGAIAVSAVEVSSTADMANVGLGKKFVVDGDLTTAWQASAKATPGTHWLTLTLAEGASVVGIEIANGWQQKDGNDYFAMNARVARMTVQFDDADAEQVVVQDVRGYQRIMFARGHRTATVKINIDSLHLGSRWPNDVSISEVRIIGGRIGQ